MSDDKKQASAAPVATATPPAPVDPNEGPGKGKAFFDRARTVAATGNYDYAIEMYVQGLNREPFNVDEHKALREVAMRRKIAGGKSGGGLLGALGGAKAPFKGKTPKEAMLNNEAMLAKDVGNISAMLAIIRNADLLGLKDVILWIGPTLKEANRTNKSPKLEIYKELAEIYAKHEEFARACESINAAALMKPQDTELAGLANTYAAQETMKKGKYGEAESFKESIKDVEGTKKLLEEENLARSLEYRQKALAQAKADYEAKPEELQVIAKYAKALEDMEDEEHENEAARVLQKSFEKTKIYRLKVGVGSIRMKQNRRNLRVMLEAVKGDPDDKELRQQYEQLSREALAFELKEFQERAENMPTDLDVKFELGKRFVDAGRFDDGIVALQEAQQNPKRRVDALNLLGRAFLVQGMKPEAVETLRKSIDEYELASTGNKESKKLHYWYARSLEENKQIKDAIEIFSKVVQWDIGYLDARKRLDALRAQLAG